VAEVARVVADKGEDVRHELTHRLQKPSLARVAQDSFAALDTAISREDDRL
jgi:hypothetical protein